MEHEGFEPSDFLYAIQATTQQSHTPRFAGVLAYSGGRIAQAMRRKAANLM